jgi:hypothetical protein
LPGRKRTKEERALGIAIASVSTQQEAAEALEVTPRTIRNWIAEFEAMPDSELDAFVSSKKRAMSGMWSVLGLEAQEFAQELRALGKAKEFLSAMTAAGIASTKLEALGQPRNITTQATSGPVFTTPFNPTSAPSEQRTAENSKEPQGSE